MIKFRKPRRNKIVGSKLKELQQQILKERGLISKPPKVKGGAKRLVPIAVLEAQSELQSQPQSTSIPNRPGYTSAMLLIELSLGIDLREQFQSQSIEKLAVNWNVSRNTLYKWRRRLEELDHEAAAKSESLVSGSGS